MPDEIKPENPLAVIGKMMETLIMAYTEAGKRALIALGVVRERTQDDDR